MTPTTRHLIRNRLAAVSMLAILAACEAKSTETPAGGAVPLGKDLPTQLAKADAVDGKTDKVVAMCGGCDLHMDGKPEFELAVQDYKMHFCSTECLAKFEKEPNQAILALELP